MAMGDKEFFNDSVIKDAYLGARGDAMVMVFEVELPTGAKIEIQQKLSSNNSLTAEIAANVAKYLGLELNLDLDETITTTIGKKVDVYSKEGEYNGKPITNWNFATGASGRVERLTDKAKMRSMLERSLDDIPF